MDIQRILNDLKIKISASDKSKQTFNSYASAIRLFGIYFDSKHHPTHVSTKEIEQFIAWVKENKSVSQARQMYWALRFLYTEIEKQPHKMDGIHPIRFN